MKSDMYVTLPFLPEAQSELAKHFNVSANLVNKV